MLLCSTKSCRPIQKYHGMIRGAQATVVSYVPRKPLWRSGVGSGGSRRTEGGNFPKLGNSTLDDFFRFSLTFMLCGVYIEKERVAVTVRIPGSTSLNGRVLRVEEVSVVPSA
jgi:hypothetical protein